MISFLQVPKQYEEGLAGASRRYFERFPGFALRFCGLDDGEMDDAEDLESILREIAGQSFGMFKPTDISATCDRDENLIRLEFRVDGVPYEAEAGYEGWVPNEVTEVIVKAFKTHCNELGLHSVNFPEFSQAAEMTVCTARAFKAAVKAGLLPADYGQGNDPAEYGGAASEGS